MLLIVEEEYLGRQAAFYSIGQIALRSTPTRDRGALEALLIRNARLSFKCLLPHPPGRRCASRGMSQTTYSRISNFY